MNIDNDQKKVERRRQEDFDDQQNEIAGRETGRAPRFLPKDERSPEGQRKKAAQERFNQLMQLLTDPAYRAVYERTMLALTNAEQAVDRALQRLELEIAQASATLDDIRDRAARLPDGTRVYRDAQGVVRREDGSVVEDDLAATIVWRGDEPGFESFIAARDRLADLHAGRDDVLTYQNDVLGPARDRMSDEDDPPELGELNGILADIDSRMPDIVRAQRPDRQGQLDPVGLTAITVPDLGGKP